MMKALPILIFISILFLGCNSVMSTVMSAKTAYLVTALDSELELLEVPKSDNYKITTIIECPTNQKILYDIQYTISSNERDGDISSEGEKSKGHVTGFSTTQHVKAGSTWAYKTEFKTPIKDGRFIVKVGDSTVLARALTGKQVKIDYGFKLP